MTYRFADHTAELELELEADSAEGVLEDALRAFAELVGSGAGDPVERRVVVEAGDLPALLAAWLDELVYLAETEGLVPESAELSLESSFRNDRPSRGGCWAPRGKDAGSAHIERDMGATEDAASRRSAPHLDMAAHFERSSKGFRLSAVVRGRQGEPRPLVKAVTLHRLRFRPEGRVWRGRVVLDV